MPRFGSPFIGDRLAQMGEYTFDLPPAQTGDPFQQTCRVRLGWTDRGMDGYMAEAFNIQKHKTLVNFKLR